MKRYVRRLSVAVIFFSLLMAHPALSQGGLRYTITVTQFENQAGWSAQWSLGDAWGTVMTEKLDQTGRFIVLGETDMRAASLDEQDLAASGRTAQGSKTPATGQLTPAQLLVKGAITHVQSDTSGGGGGIRVRGLRLGGKKGEAELNATIYLVDSTTGQVVASTSVVGEAKRKGAAVGYSGSDFGAGFNAYKKDNVGRAMEDAIAQAVEWLTGQLEEVPWTGTVVMVRDGKVYINRGQREGVSAGQEFVVGDAEIIRDPDTGEVLDRFVTEIARLEASNVRDKLAICDIVSGDGSRIERGMMVQLP